ncbi:MAG: SDR family NAD(P)-dependent oxidoreductase, partial [Pseudomonadota bacterium]|nr:SDR family NAD(P)-dependent oxidoreductase [Pseudomonadota bacterium]
MEQATNTEKLSLEQNLQGKTALITGASSGLGVRFARVLAAAGARIIITARRADRLVDLAEQISKADGQVLNETLDVSQLEALPDFYDSLSARGWMPDILVNNAGMNISKP